MWLWLRIPRLSWTFLWGSSAGWRRSGPYQLRGRSLSDWSARQVHLPTFLDLPAHLPPDVVIQAPKCKPVFTFAYSYACIYANRLLPRPRIQNYFCFLSCLGLLVFIKRISAVELFLSPCLWHWIWCLTLSSQDIRNLRFAHRHQEGSLKKSIFEVVNKFAFPVSNALVSGRSANYLPVLYIHIFTCNDLADAFVQRDQQ